MNSVASVAQSGMNAAQRSLQVSAHNIANLGTAGLRRQQAVQATAADGGVTSSVTRASAPGSDLAADIVDQLQARHLFLANLAVFKTASRMTGSLLDATA